MSDGQRRHTTALALLAAVAAACMAAGEDWPTQHHDHQRSGVTGESLEFPLSETWRHVLRHPPRPGWPEPEQEDLLSRYLDLKGAVKYDRANQVVIAGDALYFGSSADDSVTCLDAETGALRWGLTTEGPVRLAPEVVGGRVYFGSDDGCAYCLAAGGTPVWRQRIAPTDRRIPGNGRLISEAPVRTGVLVQDETAYCFAGLFPTQVVYACALRADDGSVLWRKRDESVSPQGYLLASSSRLYVPTGRTAPAIFDLSSGEYLGAVPGEGGAYALLTGGEAEESVAAFDGLRMIVHEGIAYLQAEKTLSALDRARYLALAAEQKRITAQKAGIDARLAEAQDENETTRLREEATRLGGEVARLGREMKECTLWRQPGEHPYELILAGDTLLAGGDGVVAAFDAATGEERWTAEVTGRAYGLAVANGRLYVSTDAGVIHCFSAAGGETRVIEPAEAVDPFPQDETHEACTAAARRLVDHAGLRGGYAVVLGCGDGVLAYGLLQNSELRVVGVDDDADRLAAAWTNLERAGAYGPRGTLLAGSADELPFAGCVANLVTSQDALLTGELPPAACLRALRPYGGVAYFGDRVPAHELGRWAEGSGIAELSVEMVDGLGPILRRGALPGAGEWTHLHADAGNTGCSGDGLTAPLSIQWFGEPGPRSMIGRHDRPMPPLVKDGRVLIPANDVVICVDAYNGVVLWELEAPGAGPAGAGMDSGQAVVTDDLLYVLVGEECWGVDVATGERKLTLTLPPAKDDTPRRWGYLNCSGEVLVSSGQRREPPRRGPLAGVAGSLLAGPQSAAVSEGLFAVNRHTGDPLWAYEGGVIVHASGVIGDGRLHFIESRAEAMRGDEDGRVEVGELCEGETDLVALDLQTGEETWRCAVELPFRDSLYACYAEGVLLVGGSRGAGREVEHGLFGFVGQTGQERWRTSYRAGRVLGAGEGGQEQHPCIVSGRVYLRPHALDLQSGEELAYTFDREGQGCGRLTAGAKYLFGLGGNPRMYDLSVSETDGVPLTETTRPGCWLNIIPAGGVLVVPEYNSGCTCAYPMQASLAFAPTGM